ncbi:hypothetical protein [Laspinema olomoucense]|uniref:Ribbon-helix-helix protein CopG domain-containing protein n=1 Tax=Laspinema olomoucense D3b TaxID=2953688 RepID=A0ABT2NGA3_9CYAN|nr:hypothetical protein [Laspinema sp. D3b]MCT7981541.1 hypothetical protein [Laspinema sp. D3b]
MATKQDTAKKDPSEKAQGSKGRVQLNFRIEPDFLARVDAVAARYGISRTEVFLRSASLVCDRPELLLGESSSPSSNVLDTDSIADRVTALEEVIPLGLPRECNLEEVLSRLIDERLKALDLSSSLSSNGKVESSTQLDVMLDKAEDPEVLEDIMSSSKSSTLLDSSLIESLPCSIVTPGNGLEPIQSPSPETEATEAIGNGLENGKIAAVGESAVEVESEGTEEAIGNIEEGITANKLATKRFTTSKDKYQATQVERAWKKEAKEPGSFAKWSAGLDPDHLPWTRREDGMFYLLK